MRKNGKYPQIADVKSGSTLTYTVNKSAQSATVKTLKGKSLQDRERKKGITVHIQTTMEHRHRTHSLHKGLKVSSVSYDSV